METIQKIWGSYTDHFRTMHCVMKTLTILPGQSISYQYHNTRSEFWVVESGSGVIWLNDQKAKVNPGFAIKIPEQVKHKLINTGTEPMIVREMQYGEYCSEDDIVRLNYDI